MVHAFFRMNVVLLATYEMGRQPFGLASPAAWLREEGHRVTLADLSVERFPEAAIRDADLVGFYLPMHTATRLATRVIARVRSVNASAKLCAFGLYAPLNEALLWRLGVETIIGGEFEAALTALASGVAVPNSFTSFEKLHFRVPDRTGMQALSKYAGLNVLGESRVTGYTEASRGCLHLCRHCPIVPVYQGQFRVVQADVVLADVRQQVEAGAQHITFGDPDFFNGPTHALRLVEALHREYPSVTYDVTIKIEHLLRHCRLLPVLKQTGCLMVTSAVESIDDAVLQALQKNHTRRDFEDVVRLFHEHNLVLVPTFIAFTPWTTRESYRELLRALSELDLVENVASVQLALRLLVTVNSRLLELDDVRERVMGFDDEALTHRWRHRDPSVDELSARALMLVDVEQKRGATRRQIFQTLWELVDDTPLENFDLVGRADVPYLNEPWYC